DPRYFKIWRLSSTTDWSIVFSGTKPEAIFNDSQKDTLLQCDSELSENLKVALLDANYFKDLACNTYGTYTVRWIMQDGSAYGPDTKNASLPKSPDNCIIKKLSSS
ncbi:MAG TPA: hypothetical protein VKR58_05650, partial [Aquella sp.]|nr:hypothetical protein [Aquella sp.]